MDLEARDILAHVFKALNAIDTAQGALFSARPHIRRSVWREYLAEADDELARALDALSYVRPSVEWLLGEATAALDERDALRLAIGIVRDRFPEEHYPTGGPAVARLICDDIANEAQLILDEQRQG